MGRHGIGLGVKAVLAAEPDGGWRQACGRQRPVIDGPVAERAPPDLGALRQLRTEAYPDRHSCPKESRRLTARPSAAEPDAGQSCRPRRCRTQITLFGRSTDSHVGHQIAAHIGGTARSRSRRFGHTSQPGRERSADGRRTACRGGLVGVVKDCGTPLLPGSAPAGDGAGHWRGRCRAARQLVLRKTVAGGRGPAPALGAVGSRSARRGRVVARRIKDLN
jgi:hypothetical protein